jgi:putative membrane protein
MLIATLALTLPSCDQSNSETNTEKDADKRNEANLSNTMETDAKYMVDAYADGLMEIRMAERMKDRLTTDDAKHVAEMMITEHTAMGNEMRALAAQKQISLPTELTKNQQDDIDDCAKKTGIDLDKKYLDKTVSMHRNAIDLFEKGNDKANDADVKNAFATALPKLRSHLDMAITARDRVDNMDNNTNAKR